jgi:hypothetical protein
MKSLKIAAFASVVLYFILGAYYTFEQTMLSPLTKFVSITELQPYEVHIIKKLCIIESYQTLTLIVAVPVVLIYLFKRLK